MTWLAHYKKWGIIYAVFAGIDLALAIRHFRRNSYGWMVVDIIMGLYFLAAMIAAGYEVERLKKQEKKPDEETKP
jgi:hypothetical protein